MTHRRHFRAPPQATAVTNASAMAGSTQSPTPNLGTPRSPMIPWTMLVSVATPSPTAPMPTTQEPVTLSRPGIKHPQSLLHLSTWQSTPVPSRAGSVQTQILEIVAPPYCPQVLSFCTVSIQHLQSPLRTSAATTSQMLSGQVHHIQHTK